MSHVPTTIEDLLTGSLSVYAEVFHRAGFDDFDFILQLGKDGWEEMIDAVAAEAEQSEPPLKLSVGHRMQIMSRLRKSKVEVEEGLRREATMRATVQERDRDIEEGIDPDDGIDSTKRAHFHNKQRGHHARAQTAERALFMNGCSKLFGLHWMFCFGLCVMILGVSLLMWLLYNDVGDSGDQAEANKTSDDSSWDFVRGLYITGFVFAGVAFLVAVLSWCKMPVGQRCECPDCGGPSCPSCDGCPTASGMCATLSCGVCCAPGGKIVTCPQWCPGAESCNDCCSWDSDDFDHFCPMVASCKSGCASCGRSIKEACTDISNPCTGCCEGQGDACGGCSCDCDLPKCDCGELIPDCTGCADSFRVCWKLVTCQCQLNIN